MASSKNETQRQKQQGKDLVKFKGQEYRMEWVDEEPSVIRSASRTTRLALESGINAFRLKKWEVSTTVHQFWDQTSDKLGVAKENLFVRNPNIVLVPLSGLLASFIFRGVGRKLIYSSGAMLTTSALLYPNFVRSQFDKAAGKLSTTIKESTGLGSTATPAVSSEQKPASSSTTSSSS